MHKDTDAGITSYLSVRWVDAFLQELMGQDFVEVEKGDASMDETIHCRTSLVTYVFILLPCRLMEQVVFI